jgi:membrane-associated phospholipid phosphatase
VSAGVPDAAGGKSGQALLENTLANLARWLRAVATPPPAKLLHPHVPAIAGSVATLVIIVISMFAFDVPASAWVAHQEPQWLRDVFEKITDFGLSGWFLFPLGFGLVGLAAIVTPKLSMMSRGVLLALAARFGFLFLAIGLPGLFGTIIKNMIGRARPFVGGFDNPFLYHPFAWRPAYASLPSGHSTTAVAAAVAIGAIWPRSRAVMWAYAVTIMASRIFVMAHHPSDVIAGALVGAAGAFLLRRWFAARRLVFCTRDLRPYPGPSLRRIKAALHEAFSGRHPNYMNSLKLSAD